MSADSQPRPPKQITGYCDRWSIRAGERIDLMASSHTPGPVSLDLVRIECGDPTRSGPGFIEHEVASDLPATVDLAEQPLVGGSYVAVDLPPTGAAVVELDLWVMPTLPERDGVVAELSGDGEPVAVVETVGGRLEVAVGSARVDVLGGHRLTARRWYRVTVRVDGGDLRTTARTAPSRSPARDAVESVEHTDHAAVSGDSESPWRVDTLLLGASVGGGRFDGRLARPALTIDDARHRWDLGRDIGGRAVSDVSGLGAHGRLEQLPARAVTGPAWDGTQQRWTDDPSQWDAVHVHHDDLYDAGWPLTASLEVPVDCPSGIYAFRLRGDAGDDRIPFFVRPGPGRPTADVALLMSSATYLAYANHRMLFEGAEFIGTRAQLRPEHEYVKDHPELGRSMYEKHPDGSGVMFSSRRRPVLNLRPGADGWNFTPDTDLNAFLDQSGLGHDIVSDEDLHAEGLDAIAPYRVLVTCTHPEYWSTAMLDALEEWLRRGGRLMYLGGNGFYWRVAFHDDWPGAMELRRAEDGVRNWSTEPGESYHAFTGEYGGLWRRLGRAPNELVGVGFAAQGFARATHFDRRPESWTSRAAWIFDGVDDEEVGTSGLGGGAAGQEIDRYDTSLGSPPHAVRLASATTFGPDMLRTKEEFESSVDFPTPDPYVRADVVFFETGAAGGAVFSASSISWFGALARNGYDNDIARITDNVLRRFADPAPFAPPED